MTHLLSGDVRSTMDAGTSVRPTAGRRCGGVRPTPALPASQRVGCAARSPPGRRITRSGGPVQAARSGIRARRHLSQGHTSPRNADAQAQRRGQPRPRAPRRPRGRSAAARGPLRSVEEVGQVGREGAGGRPVARFDGVGELGRVGRGQRDHRHAGLAARPGRRRGRPRCGGRPAGPVSACTSAMTASGRVVVERAAAERRGEPAGRAGRPRRPAAGRPELPELLGGQAAVAVVQLEQQPLEVGATPGCPCWGSASARTVGWSPWCRVAKKRVRMSLRLEPTIEPVDRAAPHAAGRSSPASTLPKLPVGTAKETGRPPSAPAPAAVA